MKHDDDPPPLQEKEEGPGEPPPAIAVAGCTGGEPAGWEEWDIECGGLFIMEDVERESVGPITGMEEVEDVNNAELPVMLGLLMAVLVVWLVVMFVVRLALVLGEVSASM